MATLADKAFAQLTDGDRSILGSKPHLNRVELDEFELDLVDWGMIYGLAWGIARGEDPYEPDDAVGKRAQDAAREVWQRWNGQGLPDRPNREPAGAGAV